MMHRRFDDEKFRWKFVIPFFPLIYLVTIVNCRGMDIRTMISVILFVVSCFLVYFRRKSPHRLMGILLLISPIGLTYQTEQFHILFSTIAILLIYFLLNFSLVQSLGITLSISLLDLVLYGRISSWNSRQCFTVLLHHIIIHFIGLFFSIDILHRIRKHLSTYETNLQEKHQNHLDCKKLHTILRYSSRTNPSSNSRLIILTCLISLNDQTRLHPIDQFASFLDVFFCRLEQIILHYSPSIAYFFDSELIQIHLPDDIDRMNLPIEIFRFIRYVNEQTQWNISFILGIDTQPFSWEFLQWLKEDHRNQDRIYLSSNNSHLEYYSFIDEKMFERFPMEDLPEISTDMIDQLMRIETDKYLQPIIPQGNFSRVSSDEFHWLTLNFHDQSLGKDFQLIYRTIHPQRILYILYLIILLTIFIYIQILNLSNSILLLFPVFILGIILLFDYYFLHHQSAFFIYLNLLICLTLTSTLVVQIQYYSIDLLIRIHAIISSNQFFACQYLLLCPIYPLYFCALFRQCSWMIKTSVILICSCLQIYIYEYIWWNSREVFPTISLLQHYTALILMIIHQLILIIIGYVREWLDKLDFLSLKQVDHDRLMCIRERNHLIQQILMFYPRRMIDFYLKKSSHGHYHHRYDRMGLLVIRFEQDPSSLINTIEYLMKIDERYSNIVLHRRLMSYEFIFSVDLNSSPRSMEDLAELLFQINEYLQIPLSACIHIGRLTEVLIHLQSSPKLDIWSEDLPFIQYLLSKIPLEHCLITSSVYEILRNQYLLRIAGIINKTPWNIQNNTHVYYLLGRLIDENIFQGRNTLPLTIDSSKTSHPIILNPPSIPCSNRIRRE